MYISERGHYFLGVRKNDLKSQFDTEFWRPKEKIMIYAITCMTRLEQNLGWPDFGSVAFIGYYEDKETAFDAVKNNSCDIAEKVYRYAVVEEIPPGLYAYPRPRWFFKYDADRFEEIEEPEFMKHIANVL